MRTVLVTFLLVACVSSVTAQSVTGQASPGGDASRTLSLTGWGLTAPVRWSSRTWLHIGGATLGLAVLSSLDGELRDAVRRNRGEVVDDVASFVKPFGREVAAASLATFLVIGLAADHDGARATALDGIAATAVVSALLVPALQAATGRSRPWHGRGEHDFRAFSGRHSFPSGHTAQAFVTAAVIAAHSDAAWVDRSAYTLATGVGLSRMVHDAHHFTDVLAGAAIGTLAGHAIVRRGRILRGSVAPSAGPGGIGLSIRF